MKANALVAIGAALLVSGCMTPCQSTAKHAIAMARSCVETKDAKLALVCGASYEAVRHELADGACSAEAAK
jgi:hypothetical protein